LQQWEPVIAATMAAAGGNSGAIAQLALVLDQFAQDSDWAALTAVLRRIIGGDRDDSLCAPVSRRVSRVQRTA
jgi:hypothetical protein